MKKHSLLFFFALAFVSWSCAYLVPTAEPTPPEPYGNILFSSDRDGNFELYVMKIDGSEPMRLTHNTAEDYSPFNTAVPGKIGFISDQDNTWSAYSMDFVSLETTPMKIYSSSPLSYSPDEEHFVFSLIVLEANSNKVRQYDIAVGSPDSTTYTNLTNDAAVDYFPDWSPFGNKLVFASEKDGDWEIYAMNSDGSGRIQLTNNSFYDSRPSWSPNGKQILFECQREKDADWEICIMNADGSGEFFVTQNSTPDWNPSWLPDGRHILYVSQRDGDDEIYMTNINGDDPVRLTNNTFSDRDPVWLNP